ncbi:hypothetical protein ACH5RR_014811 [Cinchona calisaya]|uniref:Uncharacterized protein n=1 Tax=Cinchona calisaya TaxID=153742 RepID=A0ABD2ZU20_9GENT
MAFFSNFVVCFSDSKRVGCEGADENLSKQNKPNKVQKSGSEEMKKKNKSKGAPIPIRVACEGDDDMMSISNQNKPSKKVQNGSEEKMKSKSNGAPIPMSYFPVGSGLSRL